MELKASISKRQVSTTEEEVGIGRLPDAMLCHILSFLYTKDVVQTSVLSKQWRYVWTSVPCIVLWYPNPNDKYFIPFAERLLRLNTVSCLRKLRLSWNKVYKRLDEWISSVMKRDIEEVFLQFWGMQKYVTLPTSIFACKKLVILKLNENILVNVPSSIYLPSLKILHIHIAKVFDEYSTKSFLDGCPVIEDLNIRCGEEEEEDYTMNTLILKSSSLKSLSIQSGKFGYSSSDLRIVVDLPNVVRLYLKDYGNAQYDINSLPSLAKVDIDIHHGSTLVELLGKFSNTEYLSIYSASGKPLEDKQLDNFPMFHNLTYLKVNTWDPSLPFLTSLLDCSPNLVTFVYYVCHQLRHQQHPQFKVPNSLMLYLEEIELRGFKGFADEMEMVMYFLKNSMVLKKLSIQADLGLKIRLELSKKLLTFLRDSSKCEIIIH